ncbi:MAG: 4Fe-4S binding protein [Nitrososphaerota archaeon]|nr:4Fe-4S binding protein [Candidatus Geocrenenecus dongiae]
MFLVNVDKEKCTGDGECVNICPVGVFELQGGKAVPVNQDQCLGCRSCEAVCPSGAITITEV